MSVKAAPAAATQRRSWFWLQGAAAGAVAVLLPGAALLSGILLAPVLIALVAETTPGRPLTRSMALTGVAAAILPFRTALHAGFTIDAGLASLSEPLNVLSVWVACACGWLVAELAQLAHSHAAKVRRGHRASQLTGEQAALSAEWGLPGSPPNGSGGLPKG